jgi:hypothetical protein
LTTEAGKLVVGTEDTSITSTSSSVRFMATSSVEYFDCNGSGSHAIEESEETRDMSVSKT